jgi:universal stress protein A
VKKAAAASDNIIPLMKIKPAHKRGGVVVELGPNEAQLPTETLFRLKRMLVPVDFSDCSKKALAYAVAFAKQFGAEILLAYVVQPNIPVPEMTPIQADTIIGEMRESGKSELEKLRVSMTDDVKITTVVRVGHPAQEIVRAAAEADADIILLSTHGRTGLGRVFFGSVAEHVTRYAGCPVLTVREREHEFVDVPHTDNRAKSARRTASSLNPVPAL